MFSKEGGVLLKILHCSDIHLGRKPVGSTFSEYSIQRYEDYFRSFERVIDFSIENKTDLTMISGDLFDRRELSPDVLERTEKLLEKLKDSDIKVIAIEGNHDRILSFEGNSWLEYLSKEGMLTLLKPSVDENGEIAFPQWNGSAGGKITIDGTNFYGMGYQGFSFPEYFKALGELLDPGEKNVVMAHTGIGDPAILPGTIFKETLEPLRSKCDYIAGGHTHRRYEMKTEGLNFFVPGSLEYWDLGETPPKGFFLYDTEEETVEFHESFKRKKIDAGLDLKTGTVEEFDREFAKLLEDKAIEQGCIYRLAVSIPFGTFFEINPSRIEKELEDAGALKGSVSVSFGKEEISEKAGESSVITEETEKEIIKKHEELGKYAEKISRALSSLKAAHEKKDTEESLKVIDMLFGEILGGEDLDN